MTNEQLGDHVTRLAGRPIGRRKVVRGASALAAVAAMLGGPGRSRAQTTPGAADAGDIDRNTAVMHRWFTEGWAGNLDLADEIFDPAFTTNGNVVGREGPKRNVANRLTGFPNLRSSVEEQIAVGDQVVTRIVWTGTHRGPYSGVAATGKTVDVRGIVIWRFAGGRVVEDWTVIDQFGLLQQIGVIPPEVLAPQVPATPSA